MKRSFSESVPYVSTVLAHRLWRSWLDPGAPARRNSAATTVAVSASSPRPNQAVGHVGDGVAGVDDEGEPLLARPLGRPVLVEPGTDLVVERGGRELLLIHASPLPDGVVGTRRERATWALRSSAMRWTVHGERSLYDSEWVAPHAGRRRAARAAAASSTT